MSYGSADSLRAGSGRNCSFIKIGQENLYIYIYIYIFIYLFIYLFLYLFIISRSFLLGMSNVSEKVCSENQNTHFVFSNFFFENHLVYEKTWKNTVELGRPQVTIWRMRVACWIPKTANTQVT